MSKIAPSNLSNFFLPILPMNIRSKTLEMSTKPTSVIKISMAIVSGDNTKIKPKTNVRFVKQDPIIFPKPSFKCPSFEAATAVESSGREVPTAIIVAPITDLATPKLIAMFEAEFTTYHELNKTNIKPIIKKKIDL